MKVKWGNLVFALIVVVGIVGAWKWKDIVSVWHDRQITQATKDTSKYDIVYGYDTWIAGGVPHLGIARGISRDYGLKIQTRFISDDKERLVALGKGDINVTEVSLPSLAINLESVDKGKWKDSVVVIGVSDFSQGGDGLLVSPNVKLASQTDLRGKRIGFFADGTSKYILSFLLQVVDLRYEDIKGVPFDDETKLEKAFINGQLDAVVYWEPSMSDLAAKVPGSKVLLSTKEMERLVPTYIVANRKWAADNPDKVSDFLKFWFKTVKHVTVEPDFAYENWANAANKVFEDDGKTLVYGELSKDDVKEFLTNQVRLVGLEENMKIMGVTEAEQVSQALKSAVKNWNKTEDVTLTNTNLAVNTFIAPLQNDTDLKPVKIDTAKGGTTAVPTTPAPKKFTETDPNKLSALAEVKIPNIEFAPDSTVITPDGLKVINENVVSVLKEFPSLYVMVGGHTDVKLPGDDAQYLMKLSQGRADAVKAELIKLGLKPEQVIAVGYGGEKPIYPQPKDDVQRKANRRTEFFLLTDARGR